MADANERRRIEIGVLLGRGGYGEVYRARLTRGEFGRDVAIKLLLDDVQDTEALRRALDEAKLLSELQHEAIPAVLDVLQIEGRQAILSDFIAGIDLKKAKWLPTRAALDMASQVADALDAAWNSPANRPLRLIHRDIKPDNIRLTPRGRAKLLDFGIAKAMGRERQANTGTASIVGSFAYAAPERFDNADGPEGDVYSLGIVLCERLIGERVIDTDEPFEIYKMHLNGAASRAVERAVGQIADPTVQKLVGRMTSPEPSRRPTALDVHEQCRALSVDAEGPSLSQLCRNEAGAWPVPSKEGDLTGVVFVEGRDGLKREGTPTVSMATPPTQTGTSGSLVTSGPFLLIAGIGVPAFAAASVALLGLILVVGAWLQAPAPAKAQPEEPAPHATRAEVVDTAIVRPRPKPVAEPATEPEPEPVASPPPPPSPAPPSRPVPRPAPAPEPAPLATGQILDVGTVPFVLKAGGETLPPGTIAEGSYRIHASFDGPDGAFEDALGVRVGAGETVRVKCMRFTRLCKVVPN